MKLEEAKEIIKRHYKESLWVVNNDDALTSEQKSDQTRFIKHKLGHMFRCVDVAGYLLRHDRVYSEKTHEAFLCGVLLHDIGNFYEMDKERIVSGKNHAAYGRQLLIEQEGFSLEDPDQRLVLDMTEQHSTMKPWYTNNERVNYGIHIIRNADNLENIEFLTQDILGPERALYFDKNISDGPVNSKVADALNNKSLVDFNDIKTRSDTLVAYAAWKYNLTLSLAVSLWEAKKYSERLLETACCLSEGIELPAHLKKQKKFPEFRF